MVYYIAAFLIEYSITNPIATAFLLTNTIGISNTLYGISNIAYYSVKTTGETLFNLYSYKNENENNKTENEKEN